MLVSLFALVLAMPIALGIAIIPDFVLYPSGSRGHCRTRSTFWQLCRPSSTACGDFSSSLRRSTPVAVWLNDTLGWFPLFADGSGSITGGGTIFTAGIVLAVMILPVITAVTREVFIQTPRSQIEAALALGATRWEVVRTTVIPFGKSGYISGSMLGLGRALGETMALYLILRTTSQAFGWSLFDGGSTIASKIALGYAEFNNDIQAGAYIAAGLVLFVLTFVVNAAARAVIAGKKD